MVESTRSALGTLRPKAATIFGEPRRICPKRNFQCPGGSHKRAPGPVGVGVARAVGQVLNGERDLEVLAPRGADATARAGIRNS